MQDDLYCFIKSKIAGLAQLPENEIKDDEHFQTKLNMDSLAAIEILHEIEKKYQIKFDEIELEELQTAGLIYQTAKNLINEK